MLKIAIIVEVIVNLQFICPKSFYSLKNRKIDNNGNLDLNINDVDQQLTSKKYFFFKN
ncbi:hypothetical protein NEF87_003650 [Candidatus Lokiarchaeum ossiferum]|uniref:Uncharacterized protein n=1 Tax=Candidatus Lokiarchaeum ossiferum TaxID=2951803 RepID=A0ABY6HV10_9ARCH|nr:hypothetical protein NEF87_003650 [Candidatus Lokiarchaeum sp. B-35]